MKKKHLIVFDIDGTLTDSVKPHQKSFINALHQIGVKTVNSNFSAYKHHTDSYIAKVIYEQELKRDFSNKVIKDFEQYLLDEIKGFTINEIAGAKSLINRLRSKSEFAICYATGSLMKPAKYKLDLVGIDYPQELLVASNEIHERENIVSKAIKNATDFYCVDHFERITSVGDGLWDLKTANNLNIEFIGIGQSNKEEMINNGMTTHFQTLEEFAIAAKAGQNQV
ncbi:MAG: HAD family hydrolase [Bacteroidota bacterium]